MKMKREQVKGRSNMVDNINQQKGKDEVEEISTERELEVIIGILRN